MTVVLSLWKGAISRRITRHELAQEVASKYGLRLDEIKSRSAAYHIAHPRQEAMFRMLGEGHSQSSIARFFALDRSCVRLAGRVVPARLEAEAA